MQQTTYGLRLLVAGLLACGLMFVDHKLAWFGIMRTKIALVSHAVYKTVDMPLSFWHGLREALQTNGALKKENSALARQNLILSGQLQRLESLEAENRRLHTLLSSGTQAGSGMLIAQIIHVDPDPFVKQIILDRGSRSGTYIGQTVLDATGVMGSIVAVNDFDSRAILITDPSHAVPVEDIRNGFRAIAGGTGDDELELRHVPNTADVEVGDVMITSGLGGRFSAGLPVGEVVSIKREPSKPFAVIKVKPKALLGHGRQVLLIKNNHVRDNS